MAREHLVIFRVSTTKSQTLFSGVRLIRNGMVLGFKY